MIFKCPYCKKEYQHYKDAQDCENTCKEKMEAKKIKEDEEKKFWETISKMISDGNKKYGRHYCLSLDYSFESCWEQTFLNLNL